jgi:hypothetical protein
MPTDGGPISSRVQRNSHLADVCWPIVICGREGITLTNTPSPPPGWYPDPSGAPDQRYFDGARWTEHRSFTPQKSHAGKTALWVTLAVVVLFFGGCPTLIAIGANVKKHDAVTMTTPSVSAPATPTSHYS